MATLFGMNDVEIAIVATIFIMRHD